MNALQVKFDGSIETTKLNGETGSSVACIDAKGNRYALLTCGGQTVAWDCNPDHDTVECDLVTEFETKDD